MRRSLSMIAVGLLLAACAGRSTASDDTSDATDSPTQPQPTPTPTPTPPGNAAATWWKPAAGTKYQIQLTGTLDTQVDAPVYIIDMFDNPASTIQALHAAGRKVICYFSAGSSENWRPDFGEFAAADQGKALDGWPGEKWLDTRSANVRRIMVARIEKARGMGCDGVDPDNVDGYTNDTGFAMQKADAVSFITYMADAAHARGLALGLKNGGDFAADVIAHVEWEVNEQCGEYDECDALQVFIRANKPVFRIEYPGTLNAAALNRVCAQPNTQGFSTLIKKLDLDAPRMACAQN